MYPLVEGIRDKTKTNLVRAHDLSKTASEGRVILHQGTLVNFYAKVDGSTANLVLADAYVGGVMIATT